MKRLSSSGIEALRILEEGPCTTARRNNPHLQQISGVITASLVRRGLAKFKWIPLDTLVHRRVVLITEEGHIALLGHRLSEQLSVMVTMGSPDPLDGDQRAKDNARFTFQGIRPLIKGEWRD